MIVKFFGHDIFYHALNYSMEHAKILSHIFILFIRQLKKVFVFTFILAFDLIERHEIRNFSQLFRYKVITNNSVTYSNQIFPEE